ncbi:hypothetical protein E0765_03610 [Sulfuricurvum sp. IAE1]|uniref:conjugal transfer protein TraF n=1 Tax=Sulfuricurvum sp. IAE1 TaxID=2546102 RepID=UPI0010505A52|nr:conjugal transfer protein TraF [Sulfuricurvum sp. IAE1]TDA67320.1 hypothetical protein E0765_03610 [Sulfuricurvum sp. IAE1]
MIRPIALFSLSAVLCSSLLAYGVKDGCKPHSENFYGDSERGWFYSEAPCTKKDENTSVAKTPTTNTNKKYKLIPKVVEVPWDIIDQIDPEQIAEMERDAQKTALMYPTDHNVKQHRLLHKYVVKKSVAYAKAGDRLGRADTELAAWRSEIPLSAFARTASLKQAGDKNNETLRKYSSMAGIVVITQRGCGYCEKQIPILEMLREQTGFTYKEVDMAQAPTAVINLGVATTPDMFLVLNKNGVPRWHRVASGLNTLSEIKQAILIGLHSLGEIKDNTIIYK